MIDWLADASANQSQPWWFPSPPQKKGDESQLDTIGDPTSLFV